MDGLNTSGGYGRAALRNARRQIRIEAELARAETRARAARHEELARIEARAAKAGAICGACLEGIEHWRTLGCPRCGGRGPAEQRATSTNRDLDVFNGLTRADYEGYPIEIAGGLGRVLGVR